MKNLFSILALVTAFTLSFTSCNNDDDFDYEDYYLKNDKYVDSLLAAEKIKIEDYVEANMPNAIEDTTKYAFSILDKSVKRGIWYQVISQPTDDSYEYKLNATQNGVVYPTWKLKYKVNLLTSETPVLSDLEGSNYNLTGTNTNNIFTQAWVISMFPAKYRVNGNDLSFLGLTANGLKKGSKIKVVVPSIYAYADQGLTGKVPANSPLVYEFEILEIQ